jgi:hypothetical protein
MEATQKGDIQLDQAPTVVAGTETVRFSHIRMFSYVFLSNRMKYPMDDPTGWEYCSFRSSLESVAKPSLRD